MFFKVSVLRQIGPRRIGRHQTSSFSCFISSCFSSVVLLHWCSWPQLASTVLAMAWIFFPLLNSWLFLRIRECHRRYSGGRKGVKFQSWVNYRFSAASAGWCVCFSVADGWCMAEWHINPRNPRQNLTTSRLRRCQKAKRKRKGTKLQFQHAGYSCALRWTWPSTDQNRQKQSEHLHKRCWAESGFTQSRLLPIALQPWQVGEMKAFH